MLSLSMCAGLNGPVMSTCSPSAVSCECGIITLKGVFQASKRQGCRMRTAYSRRLKVDHAVEHATNGRRTFS